MNRARDRQTLDVVHAESLWGGTDVDKEAFICASCALQVFPASFEKTNQLRPYFKKRSGDKHHFSCELVEHNRLLERARRGSVIELGGDLPVPYPDRLRHAAGGDIPERRADEALDPQRGLRVAPPEPSDHAARRRRYAAGSLHLICRTYLEFPHDRKRLRLHIDGIEGDSYDAIFKHLESKTIVSQRRARLFYAPMRFSAEPRFTDTAAHVFLACGQNRGTAADPLYEVRVQWDGWSRRDRTRLEAEVTTTREEAREGWRSDKFRAHKAFVFFLGEQSATDPAVFVVRNPRWICCLFAELIFPDLVRVAE